MFGYLRETFVFNFIIFCLANTTFALFESEKHWVDSKSMNKPLELLSFSIPLLHFFFSISGQKRKVSVPLEYSLIDTELLYFLFKCISNYGRHPLGKHRWTVYHPNVISYFVHFSCLVLNPLSWTSLLPFPFFII